MEMINELALYFGEDYVINKYITVHSSTIGDVVKMSEDKYYNVVTAFTAIPTDMKVQLWDMGKCWEDVSDFEMFIMLATGVPLEESRVFFGDLDFTKFEVGVRKDNEELVLFQQNSNNELIIIDKFIHMCIADAIRKMHGIVPKPRKAANNTVRKLMIEDDRQRMNMQKNKKHESTLLPLISSMVNCAEFKYGINEVKSMPLYAFMDSVNRIALIKNTDALRNGCYSGMIDTKKLKKENLNWMKKIS